MAEDRGGPLAGIAALLESRSLTDPQVLDQQSWREIVQPTTRPFLERIGNAVGAQKARLYQGRSTPRRKRTSFDGLTIPLDRTDAREFGAFVSIGREDVPEGDLERSLSWGLSAWGGATSLASVIEWLGSLQQSEPQFTVRTISGEQSGHFGGTSVLLHRALSPDELREQEESRLVADITKDLKRLMERARERPHDGRDRQETPPTERLSAETLAEWLRSARGLIFTPYQVAAFITALQAKGFVILSGLAGTGKTQLAVRIAELVLGTPPNVIPVRPDWRDSRSLLGYYNPISERYASTELLRQLLPEQEISSPTPVGAGFDPKRVREAVAAAQGRSTQKLRAVIERFEKADPAALSASDLDKIWREPSNGVARIGQTISHKLRADEDELREATKLLAAPGTPGKRLIDALHYLHGLGNPWHWARAIRALAVFDLDRTSTVAAPQALEAILASLGYSRSFRLGRWVQTKDAASIDAAFQFLRQRIDKLFPDFDRFQKADAPWFIYEQLTGLAQPAPRGVRPTIAQPRFVILDEMNLARVEYYFAEFLSVLESDRDETGITTQALPLHSERGPVRDGPEDDPSANDIPAELVLPPYLYIVGTVNTDETTHAFSPKVLDRAFTIEFNHVDLAQTGFEALGKARPTLADELARLLTASSTEAGREAMKRAMADQRFLKWLGALYTRLRPYDLHFGFRPRDEIARFVGYAMVSPLKDGFGESDEGVFVGAFDAAVLMKVLPKFHGPRAKLSEPLTCVLA
jgi:hypothetical protein